MTRKKRLLAFLAFLGIFTMLYLIGAEMPVNNSDALEFLNEFQLAVEGIDAVGIFIHNASIGLPMFIPGFGMAWGGFAGWSTGFAFSALVTTTPVLSQIPPLALLYVSPFGFMELVAYSIGMSRSFILIASIIKKKSIKSELMPTAIEVGIVTALLFAAGFVEYGMIQEFGDISLPQ